MLYVFVSHFRPDLPHVLNPPIALSAFAIMSALSEEKKAQCERVCDIAEQFRKLFYKKMDLERHTLGKLYLPAATISWNGNKIDGNVSGSFAAKAFRT